MRKVPIRRTDTEPVQVGDYYDGVKRYYDQSSERTVVKVFSGNCYVTNEPGEMLVTILGSCIAACIRDPVAKVGGMNHFLLPGSYDNNANNESARFGVFAMEQLINDLMKLGGQKSRFETKIFGGGNVIKNSAMIGSKNAKFVKEFLKNEGLRIDSEDVEGPYPRRIHYFPDTGKVMMRKLRRADDMKVVEEEKEYQKDLKKHQKDENVELF